MINFNYELIGAGNCNDFVHLNGVKRNPLLSPSNPLFNPNRIIECGNRCLAYAE